MSLRRFLGLSPATCGRLRRRSLFTAATSPPWILLSNALSFDTSAPPWELDTTVSLLAPPAVSDVIVPTHLLNPRARPDPRSGFFQHLGCRVVAESGDGLLLLDLVDTRSQPPVFAMRGRTRVLDKRSFVHDMEIVSFVCNPLSGELLQILDIAGAVKRASPSRNRGLLTQTDGGQDGPPDRYAVTELCPDRCRLHRLLSETGRWDLLPIPVWRPSRRVLVDQEVVSFAGRLWWADMSWGVFSVDPFRDEPDLLFVELPEGSVLPANAVSVEERSMRALGMYRRIGVSEGRLRYVEVSSEEPFVLRSFALDGEGSRWTLEHQLPLSKLLKDGDYPWLPFYGCTPSIGVIDPLDANVVYLTVGGDDDCHVVGVDMEKEVVIGSSATLRDKPSSILVSCMLPPWLASSRIPSSGKNNVKNETLAEILVRSDRAK